MIYSMQHVYTLKKVALPREMDHILYTLIAMRYSQPCDCK